MIPLQFARFDDGSMLGAVQFARTVPRVGEGITLEPVATGESPRRYRVEDVDRGYVQSGPKQPTYKESTVTIYVIDANDPRRERP